MIDYTGKARDILRGGSVPRLQALRRKAAASKHNPDWRAHRYSTLDSTDSNVMGWNEDRRGKREPVYYGFNLNTAPVRSWEYADNICKRFPRGFFADFHCIGDRGIVRGVVFSLPHGRFLPGYHWTDNDEFVIYVNQSHDDEEQCAHEASGYADTYAESLRDDDERFQAMTEAETACDDKESEFRKAWADYRAIVAAAMHSPARFATLASERREEIREIVESLRVMREELKTRTTAYENGGK